MKLLLLIAIVNLSVAAVYNNDNLSINQSNADNDSRNFNSSLIDECEANETCVRFCCSDQRTCLNKELLDLSELKEANNLSSKFKVLKGRPGCGDMYIEEGSWEFLPV